MIPARTAAAAPTRREPRLVVNIFWAISTTSFSSLLSHHDHAGIEAAWITRHCSVSAKLVQVEDEVPHDEAGVVVRYRIVAVALAGVGEAAARSGPAGDVEMSESCDGYGPGGSVHVRERAVGGQVRIQNPAIPCGKPVG